MKLIFRLLAASVAIGFLASCEGQVTESDESMWRQDDADWLDEQEEGREALPVGG
jgi:hypothetical protein